MTLQEIVSTLETIINDVGTRPHVQPWWLISGSHLRELKRIKKQLIELSSTKIPTELLVVKCEDCGKVEERSDLKGWTQYGDSQHGNKYQEAGIALHCPEGEKKYG